jgi:hypothetical protein
MTEASNSMEERRRRTQERIDQRDAENLQVIEQLADHPRISLTNAIDAVFDEDYAKAIACALISIAASLARLDSKKSNKKGKKS